MLRFPVILEAGGWLSKDDPKKRLVSGIRGRVMLVGDDFTFAEPA